jgi:PAS domain-containing protein
MQKKNSTNGFSERLVSLMQQKELTLAQIANAVGKSAPSVHRWTRGGEIDYENLRVLADFLEVNWIWLRYGDDAIKSIEETQSTQNPMSDIRRKYLSEIMESEARMKSALEMAHVVSWEWNVLSGTLSFSENASQVFNADPEIIRKQLLPFEHLKIEELVVKFKDNTPHNWDFSLQTSSSSERWFTSRGMIVKDSMQRPLKLFGISSEITDRKKAEQALEFSELMMRNMIEIIPVGLCGADKYGNIHLLNPEVQRIWGGAKFVGLENYGEYKGWKAGSKVELGAEGWALARAVKYGELTNKETVNIEAFDGEKRTIVMYAKPLFDAANNIIGAIEVNQDVTEINEIEQQFKNGFLNWQAIFNQEDLSVIKLSGTTNIVELNKKAEQLIGQDAKSIIGKGIKGILDSNTYDALCEKAKSNDHTNLNAYKISGQLKQSNLHSESTNLKKIEMVLFVDTRDINNLNLLLIIYET